MIADALGWVDRGFAVFPIKPRDKIPIGALVPHGVLDASRDPVAIRDWWRREPQANIGLATGDGVLVVDLDGPEAQARFKNACGRHGDYDPTLVCQTSRGLHVFFWAPCEVPNSVGLLAPKIDVRGKGGYVVAAPSVHPSGFIYRIVRDRPIAEAPRWLTDLATPYDPPPPPPEPARPMSLPAKARALEGVIGAVASAPRGKRNDLLFWGALKVAAMAAEGRVALPEGEACLVEAATQAGLPRFEIKRTLASAFQRGGCRHG